MTAPTAKGRSRRLLGRFALGFLPWRSTVGLGFWLALGLAAFGLWREQEPERVPVVDDLEEALIVAKFRARGSIRASDDVVIASIDERALDRFGRWPWPREVFAQLVAKLHGYGAKVVAFDVVFDKPDVRPHKASAARLVARLKADKVPASDVAWLERFAAEDPDDELARAIKAAGNVILGFFLYENLGELEGASEGEIEGALQRVERAAREPLDKAGVGAGTLLRNYVGARPPIPVLAKAAGRRMAYFNAKFDESGRTVRMLLAGHARGRTFQLLALSAAARFIDEDAVVILRGPYRDPEIRIGELKVPCEDRTRFNTNFYGPANTFKYFSVADIVDGVIPAERLRNKLVFVGASALALPDYRPTPFDPQMPGVEIHATVADNILTRRFLERPLELFAVELALMLLLGPLVGFAARRSSRLLGVLLTTAVLGATVAADFIAFSQGYLVRSGVLYFEIVLVALASYVLLYFLVYKERKRLRNTMQHYLAPSVLEEMLADQSKLKLGGEKRELTVLFSDIRGFTTLSETFDAPELVAFLNEYFSPMTDIVIEHLGTFDKYIGDALMAYFGAPQQQPDHAARACRACLDMREKLQELNARWKARGLPTIGIGLGLSTGPSAFGNMGSSRLFNYTVIGDNVNIASRVEGASKLFGVVIAVAESTAKAAGSEFIFRRLGSTFVAGKGEAQSLYELVDRSTREAELRPWLQRYDEGVRAWEAWDLDAAEAAFRDALALNPADGASEKYLERIAIGRHKATREIAWRASK